MVSVALTFRPERNSQSVTLRVTEPHEVSGFSVICGATKRSSHGLEQVELVWIFSRASSLLADEGGNAFVLFVGEIEDVHLAAVG